MPSRKIHCQDCVNILGKPYNQVHAWLDATFAREQNLRHRIFRHNMEGVEYIRKRWGNKAAKAAKIHIKRDWGITEDCDIPADKWEACILLAVIIEERAKKDANKLDYGNEVED